MPIVSKSAMLPHVTSSFSSILSLVILHRSLHPHAARLASFFFSGHDAMFDVAQAANKHVNFVGHWKSCIRGAYVAYGAVE